MYWPLTSQINDFYQNQVLGPQLGTYYGYPIYKPNIANLYKELTPAQYASFLGLDESKNQTYTQNLNLVVNNADLLSLPAGSVGLAGVFQIGNQYWSNPVDPRVIAGDFYNLTGTSGVGTRGNWAMGTELRVPILSTLTADASARYDQYSNQGGGTQGKVTYKLGLEFRPIDTLLLRGNYGTAFRAPDMSYTFGGKSGFYSGGYTDYYRCAISQPNVPLTQCQYYGSTQVFGLHTGNKDLNFITAKSFGYGVVWSPTSDFNIKADYYNVSIANEVEIQSIDTLLKQESDCLLGQLPINSPTCVAAISQVQRSPANSAVPNQIQQVTVYPINIANERVSGIVASLNYKYDIGRFGDLQFGAQYNVALKHTQQQYPGDPVIDLLHNPYYSSEFKTIANATVTWNIDKVSATLFGTRYGATPNYTAQIYTNGYAAAGAGLVAPWMLYNGSVTYSFNDNMRLSGIVNNIKNSMPPKDPTWTAAPYYNEFNYNPYGRQFWLEFDVKFGGSK
jgi:outer membrane receptor protein involved in Fe transport